MAGAAVAEGPEGCLTRNPHGLARGAGLTAGA